MSDTARPRPSQLRKTLVVPTGSEEAEPVSSSNPPTPAPASAGGFDSQSSEGASPASEAGREKSRRGRLALAVLAGGGLLGGGAFAMTRLAEGDRPATESDGPPSELAAVDAASTTAAAGSAASGASGSSAPSAVTSKPVTTKPAVTSEPAVTSKPAVTAAPTTATTTKPSPAPAPAAAAAGAPTHEAVYRGGKLYMTGKLPSRSFADALIAEAAAVVGAPNVVDQYVIDPAAPTPNAGNVRVDEEFLFSPGSSYLSADYSEILDLGVAVMKLNPRVTMTVVGYTDDVGDSELNQDLSLERATVVVDYMVERGIDRSRFNAVGKGEAEPRVPNDSSTNRALNRRIEVKLANLLD